MGRLEWARVHDAGPLIGVVLWSVSGWPRGAPAFTGAPLPRETALAQLMGRFFAEP